MGRIILDMRKGFTLIELLVGLAIVAVIAGGGTVYVNNFRGRQDLKLAREEIVNNLRLARSMAISGQKPDGYTSKVAYVSVVVNAGGVMTASTPDGVGYFSRDLAADGVEVASDGPIMFMGYEGKLVELDSQGGVVPMPSSEMSTITLSSTRTDDRYEVQVHSSGVIDYVEVEVGQESE